MKKLLLLLLLFMVACSSDSNEDVNADETDTYKTEPGDVTNDSLLINLSVRAETIIENYDEVDGVTVDEADIEADKLHDQEDADGNLYENVYYIDGTYSWEENRYDFEWVVSFEKNDVDASGSILQYTSDMGVNQLNVERSAVE